MGDYNDYLVSGGALEQVLQDIHTDQQRQDNNQSTGLSYIQIVEIWNNNFNK